MKNSVSYQALDLQWKSIRQEALVEIDKILSSGKYLEHEIVDEVQKEIEIKLGVPKVLLVNSGTDALMLSLKAIGIKKNDEVITVPNSFIATAAAIHHVGGKCVFVDVGEDHLINTELIESSITSKTRAILPVHLEGKVCDMKKINEIARNHDLHVIEDAAQAFGSKIGGKYSGTFGNVNCFSLHPLKNLNACGDGGFVAFNDHHLAIQVDSYRNHGQKERNNSNEFGVVSRFDSLQAAILRIKLKYFDQNVIKRRENADLYFHLLDRNFVELPKIEEGVYHTFHLFVIEVNYRDKLLNHLKSCGIETKIHYPNLITDQPAFKKNYANVNDIRQAEIQKSRILSLPIHEFLKPHDVEFVAGCINDFYRKELYNEN
jgi:dTDP-4-amino-4,6-dideoxygalactose transaminase